MDTGSTGHAWRREAARGRVLSRLFRLLPLALALGGCAIGPDFLRPAFTLPERYAEADAPAGTTADAGAENALIEPAWWKHFQDPVLDNLMERALARNADLHIAVARVEQAEALAREAGAALLPEIDLQAGTSRNRVSTRTATPMPAGAPILRDDRVAALTTSYELDVWGRVRRANESAQAALLSSHYSRDAIRLSIAGLVASRYLALRAYDAQLIISQESEASRKETLKLVRTRLEAGLVSPLDLHQAEGNLAALAAQTAGLRQQRALTLHQLALLTGSPDLQVAPGDLRQLPLPPVPPAGLPSALIEGRPDVRQAEEALVAANAGIGLAKSGYFPRFTLTGSLGSESKTLSDLFGAGAGTWSLGLGLLMPLLDFGRTTARVDQAVALEKQSALAYQNTLQTAFKEVNDALVGLRENAAAEAAQAARAEAARKALDLVHLRYQAGYSGYLDVLEAERSSNDALLALVSSRQSRLTAAVDLFKALGGGWKDEVPGGKGGRASHTNSGN